MCVQNFETLIPRTPTRFTIGKYYKTSLKGVRNSGFYHAFKCEMKSRLVQRKITSFVFVFFRARRRYVFLHKRRGRYYDNIIKYNIKYT